MKDIIEFCKEKYTNQPLFYVVDLVGFLVCLLMYGLVGGTLTFLIVYPLSVVIWYLID